MATETLIRPAAAAGKDSYLDKANPTTNYGSVAWMDVYRDDANLAIRRALIEWDLSGLTIIQGQQVLFAKMMLHPAVAASGTLSEWLGAHRVTADWNEGEATWNNRKAGTAWGTAGGDFEGTAQDSTWIAAGVRDWASTWHGFIITQQVRDWLDSVDANYGLLLKWANETAADSNTGFRPSDVGTASERPFLWVENDLSPVNLIPIADGYHTEWQWPDNGLMRFEAVQHPPNLTGEPLDEVGRSINSGGVSNRESFETTGSLPSGIQISSVKVCARLKNYTGSLASVGEFGVRVGGTDYYHPTSYTVYGAWTDFEREWTVDPSTGLAWTRAAVNALEPIIKYIGGAVTTRMCRCYVKVTFQVIAGEKQGFDSAVGSESSEVAQLPAGEDAGAGADASAVVAAETVTDSGEATEAAGQVVHNVLAGSDAGVLTDAKVDYPFVEHLRLEPGAGVDLADLWWEIAVRTDSGTAPEEQAVIEINPIVASDSGLGTEGAAERIGLYDQSDAAVGLDAASDIWAVMAATPETAIAVETAERVGLLSRHIMRCSIESTLAALADSLSLALVESHPTDPLAPKAQSWLSFTEGDLVHVRLGLVEKGFDDYGIFRIDETNLQRAPGAMLTMLRARDKAALLIEEKGRAEGGFRFGPYDDEAQAEWTRPTSRAIARRLATQVGLGLIWDAPNYPLKSFAIGRDEPMSTALQRLLTPLQQSRRYRTDAWVDGDNLVVRRRGTAPVRGTIDCDLGMVTSIARRREPQWGDVDVWGGTEVVQTTYVPEEHPDTQETEAVIIETEEQPDGDKVVSTRIQDPPGSGKFALAQRETTRLDFDEVFNASGQWIGRLLKTETTRIDSDLHTDHPKYERRESYYQHDSKYRLVLLDERKRAYDAALGYWTLQEQKVTRYEQFTPTDLRTTITTWERKGDEMKLRKGSPSYAVRPGTLQSALQVKSLPHKAWEEREDGKQPTRQRVIEETVQYHGHADGGGALPRAYTNANLMSHSACQQIADDMAAESGQWSYDIELRWARPFQYRKGDRVTVTHLPGGLASLVATILSLRTTYDRQRSEWVHDISLEAWAES